jgi:hypothetical protein
VRVIVTFPPGGTPELYGRIKAAELGRIWNQPDRLAKDGIEPVGNTPEAFAAQSSPMSSAGRPL